MSCSCGRREWLLRMDGWMGTSAWCRVGSYSLAGLLVLPQASSDSRRG